VLTLGPRGDRPLELLCLGAHPDDIEIGAGGTILQLAASGCVASATWVVMSGTSERVDEGTRSAEAFLDGIARHSVVFHTFRDGFLPAAFTDVKEVFEALKVSAQPDLVLAPRTDDAHQDHRLVAQLAWNTFRDHLILEYEIPKYDGDLGSPNVFVALDDATARRKVNGILDHFPSQRRRAWFDADTFRALLRLRGMEANAPDRFAEGFYGSKVVV
jgi:LmbE family N-acetylglucosaminyl deacetylase